jgi:hypothetical protein
VLLLATSLTFLIDISSCLISWIGSLLPTHIVEFIMIRRRKKKADEIIAMTAGCDSWKTWAGRKQGTDEFEILDLFRGMKRSLQQQFLSSPPPPGTTCPVCFCEPDEWHLTSSCGHAVCLDCFKAYASSQVRDKEQSGHLRCPVCPQVLRKSDAIVALAGDKNLLRAWDTKIRNQLLRALPAYRSCPKCSDNSNGESTGGGFVTPDCLSPHYQRRRSHALSRIKQGFFATLFLAVALYLVLAHYIARHPSRSVLVDLVCMAAPLFVIFGKVGRVAGHYMAGWARNALFRPITVACPCCNFEFILPASAHIKDQETKEWMENNTRLCPSCSAPITKNGGCNHMQCSHCHAKFCWACMRLRTTCGAYNCLNGGVNAPHVSPGHRRPEINDSILGRIDRILEREPISLSVLDGVVVVLALFCRDSESLQAVVSWFATVISFVLTTDFLTFCMLVMTFKAMFPLIDRRPGGERNQDRTPGEREEEMVALAIQRSLQEL